MRVTQNWSARQFKRGESAHEEYLVSGVPDAEVARGAIGVAKGSEHILDPRLKAGMPDVSSPDGPQLFVVSVDWAPLADTAEEEEKEDPPTWRFTPQKSQVAIDRDIDGNPIVNSAGIAFDQPVTRDFTDLVYEYERKESRFNVQLSIEYQDAVNSDSFNLPGGGTLAPGQGKLDLYAMQDSVDRAAKVVRVAYRISIRRDGWRTRLLDQGYHCYVSKSGVISTVSILDTSGNVASSPVRLNGSGQPMDIDKWRAGDVKTIPNAAKSAPAGSDPEATADANFLRYKIYPAKPFSALLLRE